MLKTMTGKDSDGVPEPSGSPNSPYPVNWKKVVLTVVNQQAISSLRYQAIIGRIQLGRGGLGPGREDHPGAKSPHKSVEGW